MILTRCYMEITVKFNKELTSFYYCFAFKMFSPSLVVVLLLLAVSNVVPSPRALKSKSSVWVLLSRLP